MNSETKVAVLGAGGHAKVVISILRATGIEVLGAYDDDPGKQGQSIAGVPVLGTISEIPGSTQATLAFGLGKNLVRHDVAQRLSRAKWMIVVHPRAYVHESVTLGAGTVVCAGVIIQPDTVIGRHCIINTGATIDHDCSLADFTHVTPGCHLAGEVVLGEGVFMGIGSVAIPGMQIGEWTTVGAGGVVVADLPPHQLAIGMPARVVNTKKSS